MGLTRILLQVVAKKGGILQPIPLLGFAGSWEMLHAGGRVFERRSLWGWHEFVDLCDFAFGQPPTFDFSCVYFHLLGFTRAGND